MGLKAAEPDGLEADRLLLRQYEPVPTVTTVSKLVDLLSTTFSGDLMDSLTDFERRVTSWEHDAKETLSDSIKSGHQRFVERWFSQSFVNQHFWHDRMDEICEIVRKRFISTKKNMKPVSAMGSQDQKL